METNPNQENTDSHQEDGIQDKNLLVDDENDRIKQTECTDDTKKEWYRNKKLTIKIRGKKEKWYCKATNIISMIMCGITAIYLTFTIFIWHTAYQTLQETHDNFATANEAIMQSNRIGISNWYNVDSFSIVTFNVYNLSTRPIYVKWGIFGVRYDTITPHNQFFKSTDYILIDTSNIGYIVPAKDYSLDYAPNFSPNYTPKFDGIIKNTKQSADSMFKGINTFMGIVCYTNYIDSSNKYYIFSVNVDSSEIEKVEYQRKKSGYHFISKKYVMEYTEKLDPKYFKEIDTTRQYNGKNLSDLLKE